MTHRLDEPKGRDETALQGGYMVIREWRGRAERSRSSEYPEHFRNVVIPQLRGVPGFLGAFLMRRERGNRVEFVVLTRWTSMDAMRAFAGERPEKAVVEPGAAAALADFDETAQHYELLEDVS